MSVMILTADEWDLVTPLPTYIVNHPYRQVLGGRRAIEVVTRLPSDSAVKLAVYADTTIKDSAKYVGVPEGDLSTRDDLRGSTLFVRLV